jgi:hypothetical protein
MSSTVTNTIPQRYRAYFPHNNPMLLDGLMSPNAKFDNLIVNNLTVNTGATGPWRIPIYALNGTGFFMNNGGVDDDFNTFVGFNTGLGDNVNPGAGTGCTFIGHNAGAGLETGSFITCVGVDTSFSTVAAESSTLIGSSLTADSSFTNLIGSGIASTGSDSTMIGFGIYANAQNSFIGGSNIAILDGTQTDSTILGHAISAGTGAFNTVVGSAINQDESATGCTAIGKQILYGGENNTVIGVQNICTGSNNTVLGLQISQTGSNCVSLGSGITSQGDGLSSVGYLIENRFVGSVAHGTEIVNNGTLTIAVGQSIDNSADETIAVGQAIVNSQAQAISIGNTITNSGTGAILIGQGLTGADSNAIALGYNITATGGFYVNPVRGDIATANVYYDPVNYEFVYDNSPSTAALKENISEVQLQSGVVIDAMQPVTYNLISDETKREHIGFIAESLLPVEEKFVRKNTSGEVVTIDYDAIVTYLVAEVKQLRSRVAEVEGKICSCACCPQSQ